MTPRPPAAPDFNASKTYPARDASDLRDLARYLDAIEDTYSRAAAVARSAASDSERLDQVAECSVLGRKLADQLQHLLAEFALHQGHTQRGAALKLDISNSTVYQWWHAPLSTDDLQ